MAHSYFIFKTDNLTGKTIHICNGLHDTERECRIHWRSYMYGFYDGAVQLLGSGNFQFMNGTRLLSFHMSHGKMDVEYFCILDEDEARKLILEISNNQ